MPSRNFSLLPILVAMQQRLLLQNNAEPSSLKIRSPVCATCGWRTNLTRSHGQLILLTRWRDRAGLCDQTLQFRNAGAAIGAGLQLHADLGGRSGARRDGVADRGAADPKAGADNRARSEEHTSELQSQSNLVCRLLLEKKKKNTIQLLPKKKKKKTKI